MLVLTSKPGDLLLIGDNIKIKYLGGSFKHLKIGIDAPQDVLITRIKKDINNGDVVNENICKI